jgi:ketosteroid isomerase-like protein
MSTIETILAEWAEAERRGDAGRTAALLTEDFLGIGPVGFQLSKDAWLQRLSDGQLHYDALVLDEVTIHEHPGSAVIVARLNPHGAARGNPLPTTRSSFHLVRIGDDWRIASIHHSFIAGAPGSPVPDPRD